MTMLTTLRPGSEPRQQAKASLAHAEVHEQCDLCRTTGGELLWQDELCRVVLVDDARYPGYCRVVLREHVAEMTQLAANDRRRLMDVVFAVELAVRQTMQPDKINLASLGNMTPHLHWHIIPRWRNDSHFPQPIWGPQQRPGTDDRPRFASAALTQKIEAALAGTLPGVAP